MIVKKGEETRERILQAALEALRTKGFAGASTRAIAEIGGHNPALTFYYFGSLHELLLSGQKVVPAKALSRGFWFEHPRIQGALDAVVGREAPARPRAAHRHHQAHLLS